VAATVSPGVYKPVVSSRFTDSRSAPTLSPSGRDFAKSSLLHHPRALTSGYRRPPWHALPHPRKVFIMKPGSSSPTSSAAAVPPQVTCITTSGRRSSRRLPYNLGAQHGHIRLSLVFVAFYVSVHHNFVASVIVSSPTSSSTPTIVDCIDTSPSSLLHVSPRSGGLLCCPLTLGHGP
jgi:hypothetical protein